MVNYRELLIKVLAYADIKDGLWDTPGKELRAEGFTVDEIFELKYGLWREGNDEAEDDDSGLVPGLPAAADRD